MKPTPTLEQKLKPAEYAYARGFGSYEKARDKLDDLLSFCEVSESERPRIVCYVAAGFTFWAIVLADTALEAYL